MRLLITTGVALALLLFTAMSEGDACRYFLRVPADIDLPDALHFDSTIVRSNACKEQLLWFPSWGTGTQYIVRMDTIERRLHFFAGESAKQWLDIADLPSGTYDVRLLSCGNGGSFTLRLE